MTDFAEWIRAAPQPIREVLASVTFLPWFRVEDFEQRQLQPEVRSALKRSGTYLVGVFDAPPADDPLPRSVHYIGMTKGERTSLEDRLTAFVAASRGDDAPHSGGRTWFRDRLPPTFWIKAAPSIDLRTSEWSSQSWTIWPEVVEKALLMAYAHRHSDFPKANKEGWALPTVTAELIAAVHGVLTATDEQIIPAARAALAPILAAWGYQPKKIYDDPGRFDPHWFGAEARISMGYRLWIGREVGGCCHVGIWRSDGERWDSVEIKTAADITRALARVLHSWHTSTGLA